MPRNEYNTFGTDYHTDVAPGHTVSPTTPPDGDMGLPQMPNYLRTQPDTPEYNTTQGQDIGATQIDDLFTVGSETLRPVVGWLVCIKGSCKGKDFRLHSDRNYIGRGENLDINVPDTKVSRGASIQLAYDPISRIFYVAACSGAQQNSYLNGRLLMGDRELQTGDKLRLGETELIFVPLCTSNFSWEDLNEEAAK